MTKKKINTKNIRQQLEEINNTGIKKQKTIDTKRKYKGLGLNWRDVVILVMALFFVGLYQVQAHAESYFDLNDIDTGMMLSYNESENNYGALTLLKSDYSVNIIGIIAEVKIKQSFQNQTLNWISEGMYAFPVAHNAAVDRMKLIIGERIIEAEIHEKNQAVAIYEAAKEQGLTASIVKQHRPNLFTTEVANIMPNETVEIEITYQQTLVYDSGHIDFRLPLAIKSRYMQDKFIENEQFNDSTIVNNQIRTIEINLEAGFEISELKSINHDIEIIQDQIYKTILLKDKTLYDKHDFVLRWYPALRNAPQAAIFSEKIDDEEYVLLMLLPTHTQDKIDQKREVVFIIDTSGSMHGKALSSAKDALYFGLSQLSSDDKFNIIEFNSSAQSMFKKSVFANASNLDNALDFIDGLVSNGGTNMSPALTQAMQGGEESDYLKQIIFVTDGSVNNEAQLFNQIDKQIKNARLFTIAIGSAPNNYFMNKAAQIGRGSYTNITNLKDVDKEMKDLFLKITSPVLTDVSVDWNTDVEQNPRHIPDLYSQQPVLITAKMQQFESDIILSGFENQNTFSKLFKFKNEGESNGIAKLWARNQIEDLTDDYMLLDNVNKILLEEKIINLSLKHKIVSQFTSLVAVDKNPDLSRQIAMQAKKVNELTILEQVNYPQTTLGWKWKLLLGMFLIIATFFTTRKLTF